MQTVMVGIFDMVRLQGLLSTTQSVHGTANSRNTRKNGEIAS